MLPSSLLWICLNKKSQRAHKLISKVCSIYPPMFTYTRSHTESSIDFESKKQIKHLIKLPHEQCQRKLWHKTWKGCSSFPLRSPWWSRISECQCRWTGERKQMFRKSWNNNMSYRPMNYWRICVCVPCVCVCKGPIYSLRFADLHKTHIYWFCAA